MTRKKKLIIAVSVLAAVALIAGLTTLAATTYGTKSDPLVTLSYINTTVTPNINAALEDSIAASEKSLAASFDAKISDFEKDIAQSSDGASAASDTFTLVTLSNGQTLTCSVGTELLLRTGSAVSNGASSPRLINETDATSITSSGKALEKNNMYMVTIQSNGIKATANNTRVLVCGTYTIG